MKSQENVSYKEIYEISGNCQLQGDLWNLKKMSVTRRFMKSQENV